MNEEKKFLAEIDEVIKCLQNKKEEYKAAYNKGLEDVWELVKKIILNPQDGGLNIEELKKIFGFGYPGEILRRYMRRNRMRLRWGMW